MSFLKLNNNNISRSVAFTLAEVLITLGILGVVAAILIPSIISMTPDKNKLLLRSAYATLDQAINNMINDEANYPSEQTVTDTNGNEYQRGFNYTDATTNGTKNKFCYFLTKNLNTAGDVTCPAAITEMYDSPKKFAETIDGMSWFIYTLGLSTDEAKMFFTPADSNYATEAYDTVIFVDVNGMNNAPNCVDDQEWGSQGDPLFQSQAGDMRNYNYSICNSNRTPDTFIFGIRYDGKIKIASSDPLVNDFAITDPYAASVLLKPTNNQKNK